VANGAWSDTLPLAVGENIIVIRVVAESGDIGAYTVQVRRRSANADLASLTVNRGRLDPGFRPADTAYADTLLSDSLTVAAVADPSAKLVQIVLDSPRVAGTSPMAFGLREGDQRVNVTVTAEEGNTKTYSIRIHRFSRDTTLAGLAVSPSSLVPAFVVPGAPGECVGKGRFERNPGFAGRLFGGPGLGGREQRIAGEGDLRERGYRHLYGYGPAAQRERGP
jgi:hypothetical protein